MIGNSLGPYRIEREVGRGGQGVVYLAEDTRLSRRVALKVFPTELENAAWLRRKIAREVDLTSRLNDPGVCTVHDAGEVDGRAYIAMQFVEGEPLDRWLERGPRLEECLELVEKIARIVHRAHEAGLVHRDLKPANVLVRSDDEPVVLDFGSAGDADVASTRFSGAPAYAAPEEIDGGLGAPDRRSDVFSLGALLFEAVTGERAFHGNSVESLFRTILHEEAPSPRRANRSLSRDLDAVVRTALAKAQDARYQTARDLADDLRRLRRGEPISVRRVGPWTRYLRWVARRPAIGGGVTLAILLLAVGIAVSVRLLRENRRAALAVQRQSDLRDLPDLIARESAADWPLSSAGLPALDAWLEEAEALLARRNAHASSGDDETPAFLRDLDAFRSTADSVREQRAKAASLLTRTVHDHAEAWARTIAAIADAEANPLYGGLRITPQEGLVPLGQDPRSSLFEFGHPQSGEVPVRNPWTRELTLDHATGFVFVLVPPGSFRMGAVPPGPGNPLGAPNVDPHARPEEGPVHTVSLDAFFLSKFEASGPQWQRLGGALGGLKPRLADHPRHANGSFCRDNPAASRLDPAGFGPETGLRRLARVGLTLPTEARMEYATRAGTTTVWWPGNDLDRVRESDNVGNHLDRSVFQGLPNPFGFHQVHGNSEEQVLDRLGSYELPVRAGDGLRLVEGDGPLARRGGNPWRPSHSRSAFRGLGDWAGFRPARDLDTSTDVPLPGVAAGPGPAPRPLFHAPEPIELAGETLDTHGHGAPAHHDLDGDGRRDLLVGISGGYLAVHRNVGLDSDPVFTTTDRVRRGGRRVKTSRGCCMGFVPQLVDLDGDGHVDILAGSYWPGQLLLFRSDGAGSFQEPEIVRDGRGTPVTAGRPVSDDDPDPETLAAAPFAADLDGDGDLDLLIGNLAGHVVLVRNVGTPTRPEYSGEGIRLRAGDRDLHVEGAASPCAADWDADGLLDLLVGAWDGSVWFYRNDGTRSEPRFARGLRLVEAASRRLLQVGTPIERPGTHARIRATDWDGDGDLDLLLSDFAWRQRDPEAELTEEQERRKDELEERRRRHAARSAELLAQGVAHDDELFRAHGDTWRDVLQEHAGLSYSGVNHGFVWLFRRVGP